MSRRVVFTTGDIMRGETKSFIERSEMPFIPKPFTPDELKAVISEALKQIEQ